MGYYSYSRKTYSGFNAWTIATILQALGSLFIGLRTVLPDFITIILANLFLFSGMFLIYYGFKSFADEKVKIVFNIIILLVFSLILFPFFTYTAPSANARIILFSVVIAGYFFFCALVFVKTSLHSLLKINKLVATTLILSCLLYFSRGILYLIQTNTVNSFMSAGIFIEISLLLTIMLFISLVIGFMQLNSERLEIELSQKHEQLIQSKEKFRSLSDAAFEGIVIIKKGIILEANDQVSKMFGYQAAEIIGMEAVNFVIPKHRENVKEKIRSGYEEAYQTSGLRKDGSIFPIEAQGKMFLHQGQKTRVTALRDLTERKQSEEELKKLGAAVRQSPISTVITDLDGNIEYVNPKFCQLTGYSEKEVLGKNPRILNSGETSRETYEQLWETILAGEEWQGELRNKKKNGDLYWENALITPIL
ncbi:MAG: PAS domain S-box protein, partial [Desulfobacteraceae bacterium]|nr:PAS domain S-box protein [Desulfobacteraceae bacterium]